MGLLIKFVYILDIVKKRMFGHKNLLMNVTKAKALLCYALEHTHKVDHDLQSQ